MSTYNIKLEDKIAFINHLNSLDVDVSSYKIKDNKLKNTFEFTVDDPVVDKIVKTILKQSPKINQIKEMKITKEQLAEIIREELAAVKETKQTEKESLNEIDWNVIGPALGVSLPGIAAAFAAIKANIKATKAALAKEAGVNPDEISDEQAEKAAAAALAGVMQKKYGGISK